jgi:hypothetical protein
LPVRLHRFPFFAVFDARHINLLHVGPAILSPPMRL